MTALGGRERLRDGSGWRGSLGLGLGVLVLLVLLALAYPVGLHELSGSLRTLSPIPAAAALLVLGESGFTLARRGGGRSGYMLGRDALPRLAATAFGAAFVALVVLTAATIPLHRSFAVFAAGVVAAAVAVGLLVAAARRVVGEG